MEQVKQRKNNGATISNKDQIQSYILTTAKYDFNVYEKRLLYRLVEIAQSEIEGLSFKDGRDIRKIQHQLSGKVDIVLPVASLLSGEDDKNYLAVKKAMTSLAKKGFEYEDSEVWQYINIISNPEIKKRSSFLTVTVHPRIWNVILDFSKGFRKYELATAMQFKSTYSMRFYELLSGQKTKLTYSLEYLKEMFMVADKYTKTNDFIRKVIEPAKKELDEKSPYSFDFSANKEGRKIVSISFTPIFHPANRDESLQGKELQKQTSLSWQLNRAVIDYLQNSIGLNKQQINANRDLFVTAQQVLPDILGDFAILHAKSRDKTNPIGWFINAIKGRIKDAQFE
ncbi:MAG: replication initiation protein [Phocaeicola sp.]